MEPPHQRRCTIYARYCSSLQNPRSIEDQIHLCRQKTLNEGGGGGGGGEIAVYVDRAESGTSMHEREGLQQLLRDVRAGKIDVVVAEALDRLSRDLADLAAICKRLRFQDITLVTVEEGEIGPFHVSLNPSWHFLRLGIFITLRDFLSADFNMARNCSPPGSGLMSG